MAILSKIDFICLVCSLLLVVPPGLASNTSSGQIMDPSRFSGEARRAYEAAAANPQLASQVFCYCGCDRTKKHESLHRCFETDHGSTCSTCREEMIRAQQLLNQGCSTIVIQQDIDGNFSSRYPFSEETDLLRN